MWTCSSGIDRQVYFDARQLNLVQYCEDEHFIFDVQMHKNNWLALEAEPSGDRTWAVRVRLAHPLPVRVLILPFIRCVEKRGYERRPLDLLDAYCTCEDDVSKLSLRVVCFIDRC